MEIIKKYGAGIWLSVIANEYGRNLSTIDTILKQKEAIKAATPSKDRDEIVAFCKSMGLVVDKDDINDLLEEHQEEITTDDVKELEAMQHNVVQEKFSSSSQVSAQRCVLEVTRYKKQLKEQVDSFVEQMVVRRELTDNFCFYQKDYDNINGAYAWARNTLNDHRKDKRPYLYTRETLEEAKTHDELWNSAQIQLVKEGKMHGFLRMYWAKKILEWTASPEEALANCIYLNDKYNLDGRDPNGYVGCMWSICGIHDQGWGERPIFGKIRYMNYDGCKRKFKIEAFVARYGGKKHKYVSPIKG
ncbi:deoxyribodipyrimidine photo-lyase-like [Macrobrachium nipponense]|uniref:deoxyribodipyrimidine photo-lyase-like n=1 Tax=Macrobrachium nipponense TaxID=159736 RepID=UPI0030C82CF2